MIDDRTELQFLLSSLRACVVMAIREGEDECCYGFRVAQLLASVYAGSRVKANLHRSLGGITPDLFEHVLHVFRLHARFPLEIHAYFDRGGPIFDPALGNGGNDVFERLIEKYRLEPAVAESIDGSAT